MTPRVRFLLLLGLLAPLALAAQDEERTRSGRRGAAAVRSTAVGRYVFVGIGIDDYRHPIAWPRLQNAVNDVTGVREVLTEYAFIAPPELQFTNARATRAALLDSLLPALDRFLEQTDNVVFFFAGHGHTHEVTAGGEVLETTGYIIPHDGGQDDRHSWIAIETLLNDVARLPARHILVILDSCHSGMALSGTKTRSGGAVTGAMADLVAQVSRRVVTSARANEKALDQGPFPGHSLFTGWLVEGLRRGLSADVTAGGMDTNRDGIITTAEMYAFVRGQVEIFPSASQIPDFGTFKFDQAGEFVLLLDHDPFENAFENAITIYRSAARFGPDSASVRVQFVAAVDTALTLAEEGPHEAYLRFLSADAQGKDGNALAALERLNTYFTEQRPIPMEVADLQANLSLRRRFCSKNACPTDDVASGAP